VLTDAGFARPSAGTALHEVRFLRRYVERFRGPAPASPRPCLSEQTVLTSITSSIMRPVANEGEQLLKSVSADNRSGHGLQLHATLWRCERCKSFIAIHSQYPVTEPVCPVCIDSNIELCGPLPSVLQLEMADA
jgi:hypothetical protein